MKPTLLEAKWLDPECFEGCQSLRWKQRAEAAEKKLEEIQKLLESLQNKTEQLTLLPSPKDVRSRFERCKEMVFACYRYLNSGDNPQWDASDAKQLKLLLKAKPELTPEQFHDWLVNYATSLSIINGARPRKFLPNIAEYANGPLNEYGRPLVQKKRRIL